MDILRTHAIFFSAAGTTRQITDAIAAGIGNPDIRFHDLLLQAPKEAVTIPAGEIALFVMPVYAGRIPQPAAKALEQIHGEKTPAIIACVYGNRHYDDALRELRDRVEEQGFSVISAGLFIAQHSIFPRVAAGRPDAADLAEAKQFGKESRQWLSTHPEWATSPRIDVPGNYPYRPTMNPPLNPRPTGTATVAVSAPHNARPEPSTKKTRGISTPGNASPAPTASRYAPNGPNTSADWSTDWPPANFSKNSPPRKRTAASTDRNKSRPTATR